MAVIQKRGDGVGAAGRPGLAVVQVGEHGRHHVGVPAGAVEAGALLGVIVRHVKHVA